MGFIKKMILEERLERSYGEKHVPEMDIWSGSGGWEVDGMRRVRDRIGQIWGKGMNPEQPY